MRLTQQKFSPTENEEREQHELSSQLTKDFGLLGSLEEPSVG